MKRVVRILKITLIQQFRIENQYTDMRLSSIFKNSKNHKIEYTHC